MAISGKVVSNVNLENKKVDIRIRLDQKQRLITYGENDHGQSHCNKDIDQVNNPIIHPYFKEKYVNVQYALTLMVDVTYLVINSMVNWVMVIMYGRIHSI